MGFSYNKAITLKPTKGMGFSTFLIALLTATVIFLPFIIEGSGYFTFYGDFNVQQIPFYQTCHEMVRQGNFGWDWLTDLGANFIGSYSYYLLGSPFFWITIPFPNWMVPYLMGPLLILKFACAALTAYLYIRRFTHTPDAARLGGILYAFCGFSVYNIFFNQFHEAIVIFPLLLLSLELLMTENRRGVFAICVCLAAVMNFFFFFGMVFFCIIYFIVRVVSKAVKVTFARFVSMFFESVLGLFMAAFLLLPTVYTVSKIGRLEDFLTGWSAITYGKEQIYLNIIECFFFPPDIPARPVFFPGAEVKWSSLGGWLPLFSMCGVFAYCMANRGKWIKRVICTSFVFSFFPILNSVFSAFNSSYYARWFYMPILIMCLATVSAAEDRDINWNGAFRWVGFITAAFALVIGLFPQKTEDGYTLGLFTDNTNPFYIRRFWLTVAIAVAAFIVAAIIFVAFKKRRKAFWNVALSFTCIFSIIYSMFFIGMGRQHSYDIDTVVIDSMIEGKVDLPDSDDYRIDTYDCPDNTGMFLGYPSIYAFHSVVPSSIVDYYEFVGEERSVASRADTEKWTIRNLLSVKYVLNLTSEDPFEDSVGDTVMPGYKYYDTQGNYKIYENQYYIPYGFSYDGYITSEELEDYSGKERAYIMLKAMVLDSSTAEKYSSVLSKLDISADISFDEQSLFQDCEALAETAANAFTRDKNGFTATVTRDKTSLVFFSVPFEDGWIATVNGNPVEIEKANIGFMAVPVNKGISEIVFTYKTPYLREGIMLSGVAAAVFVIYLIICLATKKLRNKETVYPEGEELIEKWLAYDVADAVENEEPESLSLDDIAEQLNREYPVHQRNNEFIGGFNVSADEDNK